MARCRRAKLTPMLAFAVVMAYAIPYGVRARTLARRGRAVPTWRIWCFGAGLLVLALATSAPVDSLASSRLTAHMAEHLLIADFASLLLVLGLTGPILAPLLRVRPIDRLRALTHPVAAFTIWALNLWLWHLAVAYQVALRHDLVHVVQHTCFLVAGMNLWMPLFGPFPKPKWFGLPAQLAYIIAVRLVAATLANVFIWSGTVFYPWYGDLGDQSVAGAVMMVEESITTVLLFGWLFMQWMQQGDERQELEELAAARGVTVDPERIARAVAAGRGDELRRRLLDPRDASVT